jgi:hypothetical protein
LVEWGGVRWGGMGVPILLALPSNPKKRVLLVQSNLLFGCTSSSQNKGLHVIDIHVRGMNGGIVNIYLFKEGCLFCLFVALRSLKLWQPLPCSLRIIGKPLKSKGALRRFCNV